MQCRVRRIERHVDAIARVHLAQLVFLKFASIHSPDAGTTVSSGTPTFASIPTRPVRLPT